MARFGQALKASKVPQQLSKASAPHNPPLALPSYLPIGPSNCFYWASKLLHGTFWPGLKSLKKVPQQLSKASAPHNPPLALPSYLPIGPTNCFYWASKLLHGTFWPGLKSLTKVPQQLSKASAPHNPPLALPSYLPIGPSNCFYWASKLLHGTFWPGLKSLKSPAAAFESLSTAQPSACFAIVPPHRPFKLFLLISPSNCFYWASKLLHGTFWPGLKTLKSPAAAFESLSTAQPSACFAIVPPHRPFKLFLLGFETATWHVLARP